MLHANIDEIKAKAGVPTEKVGYASFLSVQRGTGGRLVFLKLSLKMRSRVIYSGIMHIRPAQALINRTEDYPKSLAKTLSQNVGLNSPTSNCQTNFKFCCLLCSDGPKDIVAIFHFRLERHNN